MLTLWIGQSRRCASVQLATSARVPKTELENIVCMCMCRGAWLSLPISLSTARCIHLSYPTEEGMLISLLKYTSNKQARSYIATDTPRCIYTLSFDVITQGGLLLWYVQRKSRGGEGGEARWCVHHEHDSAVELQSRTIWRTKPVSRAKAEMAISVGYS